MRAAPSSPPTRAPQGARNARAEEATALPRLRLSGHQQRGAAKRRAARARLFRLACLPQCCAGGLCTSAASLSSLLTPPHAVADESGLPHDVYPAGRPSTDPDGMFGPRRVSGRTARRVGGNVRVATLGWQWERVEGFAEATNIDLVADKPKLSSGKPEQPL